MRPKIVLTVDGGTLRKRSIDEDIKVAKKSGYDGIDYIATPQDLFVSPSRVLEVAKKYNMPILTLHQPLLLILFSPEMLFPRMIHLAQFFPDLLLTNHHLSGMINIQKDPEIVKKLLYLGKKSDIQFSFELNPAEVWFYPRETHEPQEFALFMKKNKLPMTLDTSHVATHNEDIVSFFSENHTYIEFIHLSDYKDGKQHLPLGLGNLPIKELFQEIKHKKWNKVITYEIANFPEASSNKEKEKLIQQSLTMAHKYL